MPTRTVTPSDSDYHESYIKTIERFLMPVDVYAAGVCNRIRENPNPILFSVMDARDLIQNWHERRFIYIDDDAVYSDEWDNASPPEIDDVCDRCGRTYGVHAGVTCLDEANNPTGTTWGRRRTR